MAIKQTETETRTARQSCQKGFTTPEQRNSANDLALEYLPLVKVIAWQVYASLPAHAAVEMNDIIQAGHLGLISATHSYRADTKVPFASYARFRIRGEILDSLRRLDNASRSLRRWQRRFEAESQSLSATLQREPTEEEIGNSLGVEMSQLRKKRLAVWYSSSCAMPNIDEQVLHSVCTVARDEMPDAIQQKNEMVSLLSKSLQSLPARSRQIITHYYLENMTMKQIGQALHINESRVSQIHKSALQILARSLRDSGVHSATIK